MANINLLPPEVIPKGPLVKIANLARRANVVLLSLFLVLAGVMISIFIVNFVLIRNSQANQERLKSEVKSLEKTETGLILIRDRVSKVKTLLAARGKGLDKFSELVTSGVIPSATEGQIDKDGSEVSVLIPDSATLGAFMANVVSETVYPNIYLSSFTFSPTLGYDVKLKFSD